MSNELEVLLLDARRALVRHLVNGSPPGPQDEDILRRISQHLEERNDSPAP